MAPRRSTRLHAQTHTSRRHPQIQPSADGAGVNPRRSPRLHPQFHASEGVGAGMARRTGTSENGRSEQGARVACLRPQIQASEEGAGVARRRSPRLHPQIHASDEEGAGVARLVRRCRAGTSPVAADASLPDDDDMLREIFLRLPPQPSSLPRAAAVCKRWLGLVTDPKFHRQFYAHHRKPPLLGLFQNSDDGIVFTPVLDPPNRIPPRLDLGRYDVLDCRHGLLLLVNWTHVVVCDPITSKQHRLAIPPELGTDFLNGAVLCAASDLGHVHGGCHSSPFKVVLVSMDAGDSGHLARVYSSETGVWGDLIFTEASCLILHKPAVLVGNCLYWLYETYRIVEFNLDEHSINEIEEPPVTFATTEENMQIIQAEEGVVGFAALSYPRFQMWRRNVNGHGVATWVHWKTIAMYTILGLPSPTETLFGQLLGYDENTDVLFLLVGDRLHMVELKLMQSRKLHDIPYDINHCYYPFTSFYTPEAKRREAASLDRQVLLKKLRDVLDTLKARVAGRNRDDADEAISL